ncbi:MAG TPA: response regulator [Thermoanaerobaculia bacterium]|nr:response regulator [Thermoanaerobaculia bacterium]
MTEGPGTARRGTRIERLLLVDDEEPLVELLTLSLGELGYQVSGFTDARAALEAFLGAPEAFDALVSDISMPHLPGLELAGRVLNVRSGMPVVLTSGWVREEDEAAGRTLGILGFAAKGSSVEEIVHVIDRLLRGEAGPGDPQGAGST